MALEATPPRHPTLTALTYQYQPVVSLEPEHASWHEALVRWTLPDGTIRGPLDILPYWLVPTRRASFTRFTLQRAAHTLHRNPGASVSINLSPEQVVDPAALETLRTLHPSLQRRIILELTEQPIPNPGAYAHALAAIREQCAFVLLDDVTADDLGKRLRHGSSVDGVKLDRSVLPALLGGERHTAAMGLLEEARERFGIVVAEGVEDPAAIEALAELGVTHVQGFGIGTPSPRLAPLQPARRDRVPAAPWSRAGGARAEDG